MGIVPKTGCSVATAGCSTKHCPCQRCPTHNHGPSRPLPKTQQGHYLNVHCHRQLNACVLLMTFCILLITLCSSPAQASYVENNRADIDDDVIANSKTGPVACVPRCENGAACLNGTCACKTGFSGVACEHCYRRVHISGTSQGQLTTGYLNASRTGRPALARFDAAHEAMIDEVIGAGSDRRDSFLSCSWIIESPLPHDSASFVHIDVVAAPNCSQPSLWAYSGDSIYGSQQVALACGELRRFTVPGRTAFLDYQYSSTDRMGLGFDPWVLRFHITPCPFPCSNGGVCDFSSRKCKCAANFRGVNCEEAVCDPQRCVHGRCDSETGLCDCDTGFRGQYCNLSTAEAYWNISMLSTGAVSQFRFNGKLAPWSRTGHAAVVVTNYMYVIGGYTMGVTYNTTADPRSYTVVYNDISTVPMVMRYSFATGQWTSMYQTTDTAPMPSHRFGHSVVSYGELLVMYGGQILGDNKITSELWSFNPRIGEWSLMFADNQELVDMPFAVAGHTAHVYRGQMLVLGGYSRFRGYLKFMQQYSFKNRSWSFLPSRGAIPYETYGHSSVITSDNKIYLYGGYYPTSATHGAVSDRLYVLDLDKGEWTYLTNGPSPAYGHTSNILGGLILFFGGNSRNGSKDCTVDSCYSPHIWAFDIMCNYIHKIKTPSELLDSSEPLVPFFRYGHSAVTFNGEIYMFGGFNGQTLSDVIRFSPGDCESRRGRDSCEVASEGAKCVLHHGQCIPVQAMAPESVKLGKHATKRQDNSRSRVPSLEGKCPAYPSQITVEKSREERERLCGAITDCRTCYHTGGKLDCKWCKSNQMCSPDECSRHHGNDWGSRQCGHSDFSCHRQFTCIACEALSDCRFVVTNSTAGDRDANKNANGPAARKAGRSSAPKIGLCTHAPFEVDRNRVCLAAPCESYSTCDQCVDKGVQCMWCPGQNRCLERNAAFTLLDMYGSCPIQLTRLGDCAAHSLPCERYKTCDGCLKSGSACGWCDDGSNRGIGTCLPGGANGPYAPDGNSSQVLIPASELCQAPGSWFFTDCPSCQCNGHAYCLSSNSTTLAPLDAENPGQKLLEINYADSLIPTDDLTSDDSSATLTCDVCEDNTAGEHCERCAHFYFGDPRNGGNCSRCECNGQADACNPEDGTCYCRTKGVTGKHCDTCKPDKNYVGDPRTSTCFYQLAVDYVFTFPITVSNEVNVTQLNFLSTPSSAADVVFKLDCTRGPNGLAPRINLTLQSNAWPGERWFFRANPCSSIQRRFDRDEYKIGGDHNTTFFIYIYNIRAPMSFKISFAQSADIWLRFFITFASCFVSLLCAGALAWKVKMRFDVYRRRQRMFVEMEAMASRPFGCTHLDIKPADSNKVNPICVEPCSNYRAAVVTVAVRLPTGGQKYTPAGQTGLAVASALVTLTPSHAVHLQASPSSPEPARKRRGWKPMCIS